VYGAGVGLQIAPGDLTAPPCPRSGLTARRSGRASARAGGTVVSDVRQAPPGGYPIVLYVIPVA